MSVDESKSEIEILRQKNLEERNAFLAKFMKDPVFADALKGLKQIKEENERKTVPKPATNKRKRGNDFAFKFTGAVPRERRSSARLQNKKPDYAHLDLPDEKDIPRSSDDIDDLEDVVYEVKRSKRSFSRAPPPTTIPVEEVTEDMIKKIQTSGNKVYGQNGSSCHQCRQKTMDTKTVCRSGFCIGVRGQFCGICVINRYGEDPVKALKDPNWKCYVCRGCCNCSFCRLKEGKRPTGILAPLAKMNGYGSVMEFLRNLKGYGDYVDPTTNPENLLGFDGDEAILGGNKRASVKSDYDLEEFKRVVKDPESVLGFEGNDVVLADKKRVEMKCDYNIEDFQSIVKL